MHYYLPDYISMDDVYSAAGVSSEDAAVLGVDNDALSTPKRGTLPNPLEPSAARPNLSVSHHFSTCLAACRMVRCV